MDPMNGINNIPMNGIMPGMNQPNLMINENMVNQGSNDSPISSPSQNQPEDEKKEKKAGRRKINIEFIGDKSRRHITFSKRKSGIMKKAYELSTLTGTQVLLLVASETGHVYTFATPKLQPLITKQEGKTLIQACLNTPDTPSIKDSSSTTSTPREMMDEKKSVNRSGGGGSSNAIQQPLLTQHPHQQTQQQILEQFQQSQLQQLKQQQQQQQAAGGYSPQPIQNLSMNMQQQQQALAEVVYPQQAYGNNNNNNNTNNQSNNNQSSNILYNSNLHLPQPNRNAIQQQQAFQQQQQQQQQQPLTNLIPSHSSPNFPNYSNNPNNLVGNNIIPNAYGGYSSPQPFSRSFSQVSSPNLISTTSSPSSNNTPNQPNNNTTPPQIIKHEDI